MKSVATIGSAVLLLVIGAPIGAHAGFTEVCAGSPLEAATGWAEEFPNNVGADADEAVECEKICKVWGTTCHGVARVSAKCLRGLIGNVLTMFRTGCRFMTDPVEKENCKLEVQGIRDGFKAELAVVLAQAHAFCDAQLPSCVESCVNDPM